MSDTTSKGGLPKNTSVTTRKDDELRDYIRVWANHRLAISDEQAEKSLHTHYWVDADSLVELLKQYGIQKRADEIENICE